MDSFEQSIAAIEAAINELHDEAMTAADAYWDGVTAHEKRGTGLDSRSSLELSCSKRGNNLLIQWKGVKWYGPTNKRTRIRVAIARDKEALTYPDKSLKQYAKDWEWEMVKETELIMQSIRRQNHHLVRAIMSIRNAKQVRRAADGKLEELQAQAS